MIGTSSREVIKVNPATGIMVSSPQWNNNDLVLDLVSVQSWSFDAASLSWVMTCWYDSLFLLETRTFCSLFSMWHWLDTSDRLDCIVKGKDVISMCVQNGWMSNFCFFLAIIHLPCVTLLLWCIVLVFSSVQGCMHTCSVPSWPTGLVLLGIVNVECCNYGFV